MDTTELETFHITGVSCDTDSDRQAEDIPALWGRAAALGLVRSDRDTWAVYHRYAVEGAKFRVTVTVGRPEVEGPPPDAEVVTVPAQRYVRFATDGSIPAVQEAWTDVWRRTLDRGFVADLERWRFAADGRPVAAEVLVGIGGE
ncbi:MAG: effector binding domain-containing protein [Myxococcota bacterium]